MSPSGLFFLIVFFALVSLPGHRPANAAPASQEAPAAETSLERPRSDVTPPPIQGARLSLSIREAVSIALARNFDITIAGIDPSIADSELERERAVFDPAAVAGVSAFNSRRRTANPLFVTRGLRTTRQTISGGVIDRIVTGAEYSILLEGVRESTSSTETAFDPAYEATLTLNIRQPLLKNFGIDFNKARIEVAMATKAQTLNAYRKQVIEVVDGVEQAYWELVFAIENLAFQRKSLDLAKDLLRRNRIQVEVGTLAPIEITEAEATVASREEAVLVAEREVRDREDALKILLNVTEDPASWRIGIEPTEKPEYKDVKFDEMKLTLDALRKHTDLENARIEIDKRKIDINVARKNLLPELDLNTYLSTHSLGRDSSMAFDDHFDNEGYTLAGELLFRFPLGNRQAKADYRKARLRHASTVTSLRKTRQAIMEQVRRSVRRVRVDAKRIEATRVARKLAEERLDAQEKKYQVGLSTSRDILEDQERLANALTQETRALIDRHKSIAALHRATHSTLGRFRIEMTYPGDAEEKPAQK